MTEVKSDIWFVYDGECPICQMGAAFFKVRQAVGVLHTVDARTEIDHPIMAEIRAAKINLDDGMVIKFDDMLYHGDEALQLMATIGDDRDMLNRINSSLFKSKAVATFFYPAMRAARNIALWLKGVSGIRNLDV